MQLPGGAELRSDRPKLARWDHRGRSSRNIKHYDGASHLDVSKVYTINLYAFIQRNTLTEGQILAFVIQTQFQILSINVQFLFFCS